MTPHLQRNFESYLDSPSCPINRSDKASLICTYCKEGCEKLGVVKNILTDVVDIEV
jgi:hypothetical protein